MASIPGLPPPPPGFPTLPAEPPEPLANCPEPPLLDGARDGAGAYLPALMPPDE